MHANRNSRGGSKEAYLKLGFEYHTPLWRPHNQHVKKASYGLGIDKYDGDQLSLWVFHTAGVPWRFDLIWHTTFFERLRTAYDLNEAIVIDFEYRYPIGEYKQEIAGVCEKLVREFIEDKAKKPPNWVKDPTNVFTCRFIQFEILIRFFQELGNKINLERKPSLPALVYEMILFNSYSDRRYLQLMYNWEGGLRFEIPSMESLKNDLEKDNSPKIYRGTIPIEKLEEFMKLALEFMKKEHLFDEVYELIVANLNKIKISK